MMGYYQRGGDGTVQWRSGPIPSKKALKEHFDILAPIAQMYPELSAKPKPRKPRAVKAPAAPAAADAVLPFYSEIDQIIAYENGDLDEEAVVELFQHLIDNGHAWQLQGAYGRMARALIEAGRCHA